MIIQCVQCPPVRWKCNSGLHFKGQVHNGSHSDVTRVRRLLRTLFATECPHNSNCFFHNFCFKLNWVCYCIAIIIKSRARCQTVQFQLLSLFTEKGGKIVNGLFHFNVFINPALIFAIAITDHGHCYPISTPLAFTKLMSKLSPFF